MTMQHDQDVVKQIAAGGSFDPVEAIRAIARLVNVPTKEAPPATMDAEPAKKAPPKRPTPNNETE